MTDLTEQWKKGKLPCGWYYIKIVDIVFIDFFEGKVWKNKKDKYVEEVLAPVPSYEELQNMNEAVNQAMATNIKLLEKFNRAKWWLNEIVNNHRFTPISTAEKALKDLEELGK